MTQTSTPNAGTMENDDISLHLADQDPVLQNIGIKAARVRFEKPLRRFLAKHCGISDFADQDEIVSDTFLAVYRRAQQGKIDVSQPPDALVFGIAHNKAVDLIRKRLRRIPTADEHASALQQTLREYHADIEWNGLVRRGIAQEILDRFLLEVPTMPERQGEVARAVALLFATNSEYTASNIRDAIAEISGKPPPLASVKTAWEAVRRQLRERLPRKL